MRQMIFRKNYYEGISKLPDKERLEAYEAIMKYAFTGERTATSNLCAPLLTVVFCSMDADFEKYEKKKNRSDRRIMNEHERIV